MKKIKINKWKELTNERNNIFELVFNEIELRVDVFVIDSCNVLRIDVSELKKDLILATLKLYGFDVEFKKPKITRFEKATRDLTVEKLVKIMEMDSCSWCAKRKVVCSDKDCKQGRIDYWNELVDDKDE